MSLTFSFALSQNQTFELRCDYGSRRLDSVELGALIDVCEKNYYPRHKDSLPELVELGQRLYHWLDGKEGWLRRALDEAGEGTIYLDLMQTSEAQGLNSDTERMALGLAHLPWELLHDGTVFLLIRQDIAVLPVRSMQQRNTQVMGVQNRPLRLLFMATAPEDPRVAALEYEREEANILQATKDQPLGLIVEESGSVEELKNLVASYGEDYFDVFHITGHGLIYTNENYNFLLRRGQRIADHTPCLLTEDEVGNVQLATVNDLAKAFRGRWPRVIFLSGCHTGEVANKGTVPSMAQQLVKAGAGVVLGWARPVYDRTGIIAAQALYYALATGKTVEEAVKAAQQEMIAEKCSDWHLLRIYRDTRPIQELVTPLRTRGREKLVFTPPENEFLDENNLVKVASRLEFVGRRRALQRCLRALRETSDNIGVFIAGMGGLGKSTLAARLCTRVRSQRQEFQQVVLVGVLDEIGLLNKLASKYARFADVPALLNEPQVSLKGRLQNFFDAIENEHNQPLLLVLDDFEQNIPKSNIENGSLRMTAEAYRILEGICAALAENNAVSRLIVTCRYLQEETLPDHRLHLESLATMGKSDIAKICRSYEEIQQQPIPQRVIKIADGNPRLLKWLLEIIQQPNNLEPDESHKLLTRLEATEQKFRENILAQTLLDALAVEEKKLLARLSVFHLPVSEDIIQAIRFESKCEIPPTPLKKGGYDLSSNSGEKGGYDSSLNSGEKGGYDSSLNSGEKGGYDSSSNSGGKGGYDLSSNSGEKGGYDSSSNSGEKGGYDSSSNSGEKGGYDSSSNSGEKGGYVASNFPPFLRGARGDQILNKLTSLSLVESATTHPSQTPTYRVTTILEPLLEQILNQQEWQTTRQQAVRKIYQVWWEEVENYIEAEALEIVRLGLLAKEEEITVSIGNTIARNWVISSRFLEALELCQQILVVYQDYRILGAIARAEEVLGLVENAAHHYQQALELCPQEDVKEKAATLHNMAGLFAQQGEINRAIALYEQSLQITDSINDVGGKAATIHQMAGLFAQQGDINRALALYEQSLQIKENINDVGGKAATLHNMAGLFAQQGDIKRALALYEQSLQITDSINDVGGKATTIHQMAGLFAQQGDIKRALALYEQSLQIKENINDVGGKAATIHQMAGLFAQQGEINRAIALYEQSLQITDSINNVGGKATTLHAMAGLFAQQGEINQALALYEQSLQITDSINDVRTKAATLHQMAGLFAQQGDIKRAIALYEQSLQIKENINDVGGKAATLHQMAGLFAQQGDINRALALYEQSLQIHESINDVGGKAATLHNMAGLFAQQGDINRAIALYEQSLQIKENINDVGGKATTLHAMAYLIAQQGDINRALALYEQSLQIKENINDVRTKAATLHNMAGLFAQQGDIKRALALYEQSLQITDSINDVRTKAATLHSMAGLFAQQGDINRAIALYEQSLQITDSINDVGGKAATLSNMAYLAGETGDKVRELELNLQAAAMLAQIRAYVDLVTVLSNLGVADASKSLVYFAQAIWLTLRIQAPLADTIDPIRGLYNAVPEGDELEALLGTTAMFFCSDRGEGHPQLEELQDMSLRIISMAARRQGIETQEAFDTWWTQKRLNDPDYFIPRLNQRLEEIVGDEWLFDQLSVNS